MRPPKLTNVQSIRRRSVGKHFAAFHLALTLTITGASSVCAQTELPNLPTLPSSVSSAAQSLPIVYPFESRQEKLERTSTKLVGILGLSGQPSLRKSSIESARGDIPSQAIALQHTFTDYVVPAAATEAPKLEIPPNVASCEATCEATCKAKDKSTCDPLEPTGQAPVSLINIDIPMDDSQSDVASSPASLPILELTPRQPEVVSPSRTMSLRIEAPRLKSAVAEEISQRRVEQDSIARPITRLKIAPTEKESDEALNLRSTNSDSASDASGFTFSFSDSDAPEPLGPSAQQGRPVTFHMSSSSSSSSLQSVHSDAPRPLPKKKMVVQIEGEPAVVVADVAKSLLESESLESESLVHSISDQPSRQEAASPQRLKASLASLVSRDTLPISATERSSIQPEYKSGPSIDLQMQDASIINFQNPIAQVSVEHSDVCQAIQTGGSTLSLVGLHAGTTRLAVISETLNGNIVEIREVTVAPTRKAHDVDVTSLAQEMSETVGRLFPDSDVAILAVGDALHVQGVVSSEANARKILALIRKASMKPVVDQLRSVR